MEVNEQCVCACVYLYVYLRNPMVLWKIIPVLNSFSQRLHQLDRRSEIFVHWEFDVVLRTYCDAMAFHGIRTEIKMNTLHCMTTARVFVWYTIYSKKTNKM